MIAELNLPVDEDVFLAALEGLVLVDMALLQKYDVPPLYTLRDRIAYKNGKRQWDHLLTVLQRGTGDCKDLSAWFAAEMRVSGEDPEAKVRVVQTSPSMCHAFVLLSDGRIVDPTIDFGGAPHA